MEIVDIHLVRDQMRNWISIDEHKPDKEENFISENTQRTCGQSEQWIRK